MSFWPLYHRSKRGENKYDIHVAPSVTNGLKVPSTIICSKLATLEKTVLLGELGFVDEDAMKQVKSKLTAIFDL
jgi:mRNA-degrading endonuclease toxin of MazEF toxin-antitoxin module